MMTAPPPGWALDPQGPVSEAMANLFWLMLGLGGAVFVAVVVVLGLGLFRRRPVGEPQPDRQGRDSFGRWFVVGGVVVPLVILLIVFGATVRAMRFVPTSAPPEALVIEVVGHQFWWEVRYPEQGVTVRDELHLPVGRRVNLQLSSADVIHSFWVPELAGKLDLLPDHTNTLVLEADQPGVHTSRCAEFSGLEHTRMVLTVVAESEERFAAWVAERRG
ncbi:MAG TPA: cytochrome c oxidase subunit II [Propionibacteriaceae bacterium]|nr:cytochrome c oxidase subunit II [Propionibacteriaceae bacterium]